MKQSDDVDTAGVDSAWPLVDARDDGIRPAGKPDACFYCGQRVGTPHGAECCVVTKQVALRIIGPDGTPIGVWSTGVPYSHSAESIEFRHNESTWCADNLFDHTAQIEWADADGETRLRALNNDGCCLCSKVRIAFVRVLDETPRRPLKSEARP